MNPATQDVDVIVLGGGAAGLFCAAQLGACGQRVVVLDHANKVGKKILMSGGGRCNFTHMEAGPANFRSQNPHFCRSALAGYTPAMFLQRVEQAGIAWVEKTPGQLFCRDSAKDLLGMLLDDCAQAGVQIRTHTSVDTIEFGSPFVVRSATQQWRSRAVVVATGGLSIPKMGASGFGYQLAQQAGHELVPTRAGLVPFTLSGHPAEVWCDLAGVSSAAQVGFAQHRYGDALLITHRGLSGPAVLQISSHWQPGADIHINWLPGVAADALLEIKRQTPQRRLQRWLSEQLPERLAERLLRLTGEEHGRSEPAAMRLDLPIGEHRDVHLRALQALWQNWPLRPSGTEGYRTAEVTEGGVATDAISSKTMESRHVPGLHFIGEVLDVTGELGGYNFQWAWASAHACARALSEGP